MNSRLLVLLATAGILVAASATPSAAHWRYTPRCRIVSLGLIVQTSRYQEPDGTYDSISDFVRDVNGTPCGVECSRPWRSVVWFASPPGYVCY
jgi:hypothetical protein